MQTAEVIPFITPTPPEPVERICSFCKRGERNVSKMFSNGREGTPQLKCMCNHCVVQAGDRLRASMAPKFEEVPS
jgi:hypothetical protein